MLNQSRPTYKQTPRQPARIEKTQLPPSHAVIQEIVIVVSIVFLASAKSGVRLSSWRPGGALSYLPLIGCVLKAGRLIANIYFLLTYITLSTGADFQTEYVRYGQS